MKRKRIMLACATHSAALGNHVSITEYDLRGVLADEAMDFLLEITGHWLCCRSPEWLWEIGWKWEPEHDLYKYSLGSWLWSAVSHSFAHASRRQVAEIPLDDEAFRAAFPEEFLHFDQIFSKCGDGCGVTHDQYECREYWLARLARDIMQKKCKTWRVARAAKRSGL